MHASVPSFAVIGIDALPIAVEADCVEASALEGASWTIVGLGDAAVKESRERAKAALKNSGMAAAQRRVTVNLAPADVKKVGSHYDLPIALAVLAGMRRLDQTKLGAMAAVGELGLDGAVKPIPGALPMAIGAKERQMEAILVPRENAAEAAVVEGLDVIPIATLNEAVAFLRGEVEILPARPAPAMLASETAAGGELDMRDVVGQEAAKRALEIAAAGAHNVIMIGPPGSGKTMLAKRFSAILPEMSFEESMETSKIFSIAGLLDRGQGLMRGRPFRSPHHTASNVSLVGGGMVPRPGEVSLGHNGVLFLDELPEFSRQVLEVLRQPLEDGVVTISRAQMTLTFPANFILVAAMNPCPCGYRGHPEKECLCNFAQVSRYQSKISGPLMDRIDLHVDVGAVKIEDLRGRNPGETSATVRDRVATAREVQSARFAGRPGMFTNSQMTPKDIKRYCALDDASHTLLESAMKGLNLTARAYHRIIKVARTIADLTGDTHIQPHHLSEAVQYRTLDRQVVL